MVEVVFIIYALYNIKKIITIYRKDTQIYYYPSDKVESVLTQVYGERKILSVLVSEFMVFYYALFGWFIKESSFTNSLKFTYHKETMYSIFFWVLFILMVIETPIVHYFLSLWNENVAWVVTGLTIYGMVWFIGDYKAIKHYPIRVTKNYLFIRIGLRIRIDIKLTNIDSISSSVKEEEKEDYENALLMTKLVSESNVYLVFKEKVKIKGLFGMEKEIDKVALYVDEPSRLIEYIKKEK